MKIDAPFSGPFHGPSDPQGRGADRSPYIIALKRSLVRWTGGTGALKWQPGGNFNATYNAALEKDVAAFKKHKGIATPGSVWGFPAHRELLTALRRKGAYQPQELAVDATAVMLMEDAYNLKFPGVRDTAKVHAAIQAFLEERVLYATRWHYLQYRPVSLGAPPVGGGRDDCSALVIEASYWARVKTGVQVPDPAGYGFSGFGNCHEPSARLLTKDLRWVAAGDIKPGDELWALDENLNIEATASQARARKYRSAFVVESFLAKKECVRVCLDTGESFICSSDHPWLSCPRFTSFRRWTQAKDLLRSPHLIRSFIPWTPNHSYEAGWLAGMFDGEGWVRNPGFRHKRSQVLGVTQKVGPTAERLVETATRYGDFNIRIIDRPGENNRIELLSNGGGIGAMTSFLGTIRPERLIANFNIEGGTVQGKYPARVVAIEPVGARDIQSIETTTGTYFAEGFAVHNTVSIYQTNRDRKLSLSGKFEVADVGLYGYGASRHAVECVSPGDIYTSVWVSNGSEAGPYKCRLRYRTDLFAAVRPILAP